MISSRSKWLQLSKNIWAQLGAVSKLFFVPKFVFSTFFRIGVINFFELFLIMIDDVGIQQIQVISAIKKILGPNFELSPNYILSPNPFFRLFLDFLFLFQLCNIGGSIPICACSFENAELLRNLNRQPSFLSKRVYTNTHTILLKEIQSHTHNTHTHTHTHKETQSH